jgi:hypothetical protein
VTGVDQDPGLWAVLYRERFGVTPDVPDAINPDCLDGKHAACSGTAWSDDLDVLTDCLCDCHNTTTDAVEGVLS